LSHTNNQNFDPKKDIPSSSKKNALKVFPMTQADVEEKIACSSKEIIVSEERKETEA